MEKRVEVKTYMIYKECPICRKGIMLSDETDPIRLTDPPQYKYKCNKCGWESWSLEHYPRREYEPIENS